LLTFPPKCLFYTQALEQINLHNEYPSSSLHSILHNSTDLARLRGHLQIDGEIVLWAAFWVGVSSIMSGVSLDDLITSSASMGSGNSGGDVINLADAGSVDGYNTYNDMYGKSANNDTFHSTYNESSGRVRSDSELARELQAQMDGELLLEATGGNGSGGTSSGNVGYGGSGGTSGAVGSSGVKSGTTGTTSNTGGISALDFSSLTSILNNTTTNTTTNTNATANTTTINHTSSMEVGPPTPASASMTIPSTPYTSTTTPNTPYTGASTNPTSPIPYTTNTTTTTHPTNTNSTPYNTNTSSSTTNTASMRERSDSELARELQAQWDAEDAGNGGGVNGDGFSYDSSAFDQPDSDAGEVFTEL